jgi:hypothetical protein
LLTSILPSRFLPNLTKFPMSNSSRQFDSYQSPGQERSYYEDLLLKLEEALSFGEENASYISNPPNPCHSTCLMSEYELIPPYPAPNVLETIHKVLEENASLKKSTNVPPSFNLTKANFTQLSSGVSDCLDPLEKPTLLKTIEHAIGDRTLLSWTNIPKIQIPFLHHEDEETLDRLVTNCSISEGLTTGPIEDFSLASLDYLRRHHLLWSRQILSTLKEDEGENNIASRKGTVQNMPEKILDRERLLTLPKLQMKPMKDGQSQRHT